MQSQTLVNRLVPTLYEDDHLLVVDKPAGIDVGPTAESSVRGLSEIVTEVRGRGERLEPVNRLSRYESGVLLLGKEPAIVSHIRTGLRTGRITQEYVAVVLGRMSRPRLSIGAALQSDRGNKDQRRAKRRRSQPKVTTGATTSLNLMRQGERRALIKCRTTARTTHALRAHLRSARLRLLGDSVHDSARRRRRSDLTCLHLARIAFHHSGAGSRITISSKAPAAFNAVVDGQQDAERMLHAALVRRLVLIVDPETNAYRLLTGNVEGIKGLVVEQYGSVVILQLQDGCEVPVPTLRSIARWYRDTLDVGVVYVKRLSKDRPADATPGAHRPKPLVGKAVTEQVEIMERGLRFIVRPYDSPSVGLFLDHRDNRTRIRSMAEGKTILDLFAFTCGFSVATAAGGAKRTVSVAMSPKHLQQGRENFIRNKIDLTHHEFVCTDAFDYLKRAQRQNRRFDMIILDPPTFAHGRKRERDFSITRDLSNLIAASAVCLEPGGVIMISTKYRRMSLRTLREHIKQGIGRRKFKVIATPPLPIDFAVDPDHAKTILVRLA